MRKEIQVPLTNEDYIVPEVLSDTDKSFPAMEESEEESEKEDNV